MAVITTMIALIVKMMLSYSISLIVLANHVHVHASVLHNGVDIDAKLPMPIPVAAIELDDELLAIKTSHETNEFDKNNLVDTRNVSVKTPFLTVQVSNSSKIPKDAPPPKKSSPGQTSSSLPKASDLSEAIEYLDIPVRVAELANLATAETPEKFREKLNSSPLLEHIISDIEDKAKYYNEVTNLLNQPGALPTEPPTKKRVAKREAIFSLQQNLEGPKVTVNVRQRAEQRPRIDGYSYSTSENYSEYEPREIPLSVEPSDIDSLTQYFNSSANAMGAGDDPPLLFSTDTAHSSPEGRDVLPRTRLYSHPLGSLAAASRTRGSRRPLLSYRPLFIHPIIRPLIPPSTWLPIVRAFANPKVIRSLIEAIPTIPPRTPYPMVIQYGQQVVTPVAGIYSHEEPPAYSEFNVPRYEERPLSPLVDTFSTLLEDFSVTR